jgi:putative flippase GtrA
MKSPILFHNYRRLWRWAGIRLAALPGPYKFGLVGLSGLAVDATTFHALRPFAALGVARAAAIGLAMTWNFWLNRQITFAHARSQNLVQQYLLFCLSCSLGALASWSTSLILIDSSDFIARHSSVAIVAGAVAGAVSNYALCITAVFRKTKQQEATLAEVARVETYQIRFADRTRSEMPTRVSAP